MKTKAKSLEITYCATFTALIAACSWISIPANVPFTMQTFAVFLTVLLLGGKLGTLSIATYLLLGAVGAPVFAGFSSGMGVLLGTTGGYLLGFLAISMVYTMAVKTPLAKLPVDVAILVLGLTLCYLFGTLQFVTIYSKNMEPVGMFTALGWCVFPYIIPDLLKMALAITLAKRLKPYVKV